MRWTFVLLILITGGFSSLAQNREPDIKFRLAQSYDQSGDFESAAKLYEQVLARDSTNIVVIDALHRDYIQLKKYDAAIDLIQRVIRRSPNDIFWLSRLGSLHNLKANDTQATDAWNRAIAVDPTHESTYRTVASSLIESRLFDRAIEIYQRGRTACKNPDLFTTDIAYLYGITLNYPAATKEYLALLRQSPAQLSFIQARIASYVSRPEGLKSATDVVEESAKSNPDNESYQQLLAWLYMEAKNYDRAFQVYKLLDSRMNAQGHEIFSFAERAFRDRGYATAAVAYRDIISRFPKFDQLAQVKFGLARTIEELSALSDTANVAVPLTTTRIVARPESESGPLYGGAITAYQAVVTEFPRTEFAARSLFRIAVLKQERFADLDGARAAIETLEKSSPPPVVLLDATLRKGEIYLAMGNFPKAEEVYAPLANQQPIMGEHRERAALRMAELAYFQGRFSDAMARLQKLTRNAGSDITNDALKLQIFIQEHLEEGEPALKEFARGEAFMLQRKISEALSLFTSMPAAFPGSALLDEASMYAGNILTALRRYPEAIKAYESMGLNFPESVLLDAALMNIGALYESALREKPKAIETYQKLLERYPNSLYVNEARRRIRELRGDVL